MGTNKLFALVGGWRGSQTELSRFMACHDQREQFPRCLRIALLDAIENVSDLAHGLGAGRPPEKSIHGDGKGLERLVKQQTT